MKLKVGDKVRLVSLDDDNHSLYYVYINKTGVITKIVDDYAHVEWEEPVGFEYGSAPYLKNLELVSPKQFTKSDLKDNHIVVYENGLKQIWGKNTNKSMLKEDLTRSHKIYTEVIEVWEFDKCVWKREEKPVEILDEVEKKYLNQVVRPFREQISYIKKRSRTNGDWEDIVISIKNDKGILYFPEFEPGIMYKGMELNKEYTIEELGLEQ